MYVLATGTEVVLIFLALGSAAASYFLARQKKGGDFKADTAATTLTTKGEFLQYVIGRHQVSPYFVWAGDRRVTPAGGGGKGGSGSPGGNNYTESACHALALGPVDRLRTIYQEGKAIWSGDINRFSTPSGTRITVSGEGSFEIYWGEIDQPVCAYLAAASRIGIASSYPYHCYVVWIDKVLGSSARWPQIEYDIEALSFGSLLSSSPRTFPSRPGVNPAHIFYQLTTGTWPHGAADDPNNYDFGELENLGLVFQDEELAFNVLIKDGSSVQEVLATILQDAGFVMPQIGGKIVPIIIRVPTDWPRFSKTHLTNPLPAIDIVHGQAQVDRVIYSFLDYTRKFSPSTIQVDEDGEFAMRDNRKPNRIDLPNVIDRFVAVKVADRRQAEAFLQGSKFDLQMLYSARMLAPGMPFEVEGFGRLRVSSVTQNTDDGQVNIKATLDQFGSYSGFDPAAIAGGAAGTGPAPDKLFRVIEVPYGWRNTDQPLLVLLRIRANPSVGGGRLLISADNTTFYSLGNQANWCRGGTTEADINIDDPDIIESSVVIRQFNSDMSQALDLSADPTGWLSGRQMALIGDELFFLQSVTALGDGRWQLNGLVRNCLGTARSKHAAGSNVFIFEKALMTTFSDPSLVNGRTLYYKSQPVGVSAEAIPSMSVVLMGWAAAPYCPTALFSPLFYTSGDLTLAFATRVKNGLGRASGEQGAGVISTSTIPSPWFDGSIRVRIRDMNGVLKRTFADSTTTSILAATPTAPGFNNLVVTYTSANRATDLGGDVDFICEVASVSNERISPFQQFIVRKV